MEEDEEFEMDCDQNIKLFNVNEDYITSSEDMLSAGNDMRQTNDGFSEGRWTDEEHEKFLYGKMNQT
jgi:hypothetical protein